MVRLIDLPQPEESALDEVLAGLSRNPKELPAKYFYDDAGSALFERICALPEYYLTRAELQLMERHVEAIAAFLGRDVALIEFGCGSGLKTRILIEALRPIAFVPVDISRSALESACAALAERFPQLSIVALRADFTRSIAWPAHEAVRARRRAVYFPGSTIGNFTRQETIDFLARARDLVGPGGALVVGVDLKKPAAVLTAAYNDAAGVTAAFNLNLLSHLNRTLGANFDLSSFSHCAFYAEEMGRIEMHLRSLRPQIVTVGRQGFSFGADELMRTEISCKYSIEEFQQLGRIAGFEPEHVWHDDERLFSVHGMTAR